jgi:hypothetical protein
MDTLLELTWGSRSAKLKTPSPYRNISLKPIQLFCAAFIYLSGFVACAQNPLRVEKLPDLKPGDTREYADRLMTVPCRQWTTIETNKDGYLVFPVQGSALVFNSRYLQRSQNYSRRRHCLG